MIFIRCYYLVSTFRSKVNKKFICFILLVFFSCKVGDEECYSELQCQSCDLVIPECQNGSIFANICEKSLAWFYLRNFYKCRKIRTQFILKIKELWTTNSFATNNKLLLLISIGHITHLFCCFPVT